LWFFDRKKHVFTRTHYIIIFVKPNVVFPLRDATLSQPFLYDFFEKGQKTQKYVVFKHDLELNGFFEPFLKDISEIF